MSLCKHWISQKGCSESGGKIVSKHLLNDYLTLAFKRNFYERDHSKSHIYNDRNDVLTSSKIGFVSNLPYKLFSNFKTKPIFEQVKSSSLL
jgi:hypothetical protein